MDPEEFRAAGHALIDWIADYRASLPDRPVTVPIEPGTVHRQLPDRAPDAAEPFGPVLRDLDEIVVPATTLVQHPRHFGWFPSNAALASVLGDLASSGLGALGISWQSAPALTELEEVMTDWMRELVGLSDAWKGTIHDTASTATLVALLCARERHSDHSQERAGLAGTDRHLVVYASEEAHSSVAKAALLAGFGRDNLRMVPVDPATRAMRTDVLENEMLHDRRAGRIPAAVVATVGTTATTAVDPVREIVAIARSMGAWVHVDAALAGSAMLLPECRGLWDGVEDADSLCWNPHKWMGTVLDCSLYYVRDVQHLTRVMGTNPSYLRSGVDGEVTQFRDWGIPLGRRFRALKLWFHLRLEGADAIRDRLRRDLGNARWLADAVAARQDWEVLTPVPLQTVCVRHRPPDLDGDALDEHTLAWVDLVNRSGEAYLTPALLDGRWMARVSIGVETTERADVEATWALLQAAAETARVERSLRP